MSQSNSGTSPSTEVIAPAVLDRADSVVSDVSGEFQLDAQQRKTGRSSFSDRSPPQHQREQRHSSEEWDDVSIMEKLTIDSFHLHGRKREISILHDALDSMTQATTERRLVLISGSSGSGKTKLAETIKLRMLEKSTETQTQTGLYVQGKYDLNMRTQEPYSGITAACSAICGSILRSQSSTDPARANLISQDIQDALGVELKLLIQVIPAIDEVVVDPKDDSNGEKKIPTTSPDATLSSSPSSSSPSDSKHRIQFAFLRFLRVVAKHFAPLVIVLDDLQWADESSLDLLEVLLSDHSNPKFMVIGIYRSNEVNETHRLFKCLRNLETKSIEEDLILSKIEVEDLGLEAVDEIIQDVLHCQGDARTRALAQICLDKTHGNPFFLLHYLAMLYNYELLQFDPGARSWIWNDEEIRSDTTASENVTDLLKFKMVKLSQHLLTILKLASCLGSTFEVKTLRLIWQNAKDVMGGKDGMTSGDTTLDAGLEKLEAEGLFVKAPEPPPRYRWVHDKIHEAALELIPEEERSTWSRRVGEILLSELDEAELGSAIFVVANLLNSASRDELLLTSRLDLARLNYEASLKAIKVSAFESASKYSRKGIESLPHNAWDEHYELSLKLYNIGAKAEGFLGNIVTMEQYCNAVLSQRDKPIEDKLDVYYTLIDSIMMLAKPHAAVNILLDILKEFNCQFPKSSPAIRLAIAGNVLRIKATMKSRDPSKLSPMKDRTRVVLMRLLDKLASCFYVLKDGRMSLVVFRSLNWTFKYGFCDSSPPTIATTGIILTGILDDIQGGSLYGQRAIDLLSQTPSKSTAARTMFCVYALLFPWTQPLTSQLEPLLDAYDVGLHKGDTESAIWSIYYCMVLQFSAGTPLHMIEADMILYAKQMKDLKREQATKLTKVMRQFFLNLTGRDNQEDPTSFSGEAMTEEDLEKSRLEDFWNAGVTVYHGVLFTYFGEHAKQADFMIKHGHDYFAKAHVASPNIMIDTYMKGVSLFAVARQTGKKKYARLGQVCRTKVRNWLEKGNPNVKHYDSLLDAEFLAFKGRLFQAIKQYEVAILLSAQGGYQHDAALASERMAEFHIEVMKDLDVGTYRLHEAVTYWRSWGAMAKVEHLENKYADLLRRPPGEIVSLHQAPLVAAPQ